MILYTIYSLIYYLDFFFFALSRSTSNFVILCTLIPFQTPFDKVGTMCLLFSQAKYFENTYLHNK